jgi:hypothetical protein
MRSALQRRIAHLENAFIEKQSPASEPLNGRSFLARVEKRRRLSGESFDTTVQALLVQLTDEELDALLEEAEASETKAAGSDSVLQST